MLSKLAALLMDKILDQIIKFTFFNENENHEHDDHQGWAPTQMNWAHLPVPVDVPAVIEAESVKRQLPVLQYRNLISKGSSTRDYDSACIVCMNCIEATDGVRELCNCRHVFHSECLDSWIGQGHVTCPLCRSNLVPETAPAAAADTIDVDTHLKVGEDPWRRERMLYLFGDDHFFHT